MKINDDSTNKVYFSSHLKRFKCWDNIQQALESQSVQYGILPETKDIWIRDFMPIQIQQNYFLDYNYNPDYLKNLRQYITVDKNSCYDFLNSHYEFLEMTLDGGNFINCDDKIILTDKIFLENKSIDKRSLIKSLEVACSAEVILLPWDTCEPYGHADGMVRYVEPGHVVINHYNDYDEQLRSKVINILSKHFKSISELSYGSNARNLSWSHLNFLRVGNLLFVPQLNIASDETALAQLKEIYTECAIVPVNINGIVQRGGGLNCVSWNIAENSTPTYASTYEHYAEAMHHILVKEKIIRTTISDLFISMIDNTEFFYTTTKYLPDMFTLTLHLWNCIKKHKLISIKNIDPSDAVTGLPYNILYEFKLKGFKE